MIMIGTRGTPAVPPFLAVYFLQRLTRLRFSNPGLLFCFYLLHRTQRWERCSRIVSTPLQISGLLHGNGKVPARPTSGECCSAGGSGVIFSTRLVSDCTFSGLSATSGYVVRDLLAPSLPLQRNNTTNGGKIQLAEKFKRNLEIL